MHPLLHLCPKVRRLGEGTDRKAPTLRHLLSCWRRPPLTAVPVLTERAEDRQIARWETGEESMLAIMSSQNSRASA